MPALTPAVPACLALQAMGHCAATGVDALADIEVLVDKVDAIMCGELRSPAFLNAILAPGLPIVRRKMLPSRPICRT